MEIELIKKSESFVEDVGIVYTQKIIVALKSIIKEHNDASPNKVNIEQLKKVFIYGASKTTKDDLLIIGLARVTMFLNYVKNNSFAKEIKQFINNRGPLADLKLEIDEILQPKEDDFLKAHEYKIKYNLDFSFGSVDELYLITPKKVILYKEYL
jgi:hypothetical protein